MKSDLKSGEIYKFSKKNFNVLFFGLIKDSKGLDILLDAVSKTKMEIPNIKLHIYGKVWKSNNQKYVDKIEMLKIEKFVKTRFEFIDDKDIPFVFQHSDLVVLPYKVIYQSGVLLFSMTYRKAVLVSDLPPFLEVIQDNINGFVFKENDVNDLANKLKFVNANKAKIEKVGHEAYKTAKDKFDWKEIGISLGEIYNSPINVNN